MNKIVELNQKEVAAISGGICVDNYKPIGVAMAYTANIAIDYAKEHPYITAGIIVAGVAVGAGIYFAIPTAAITLSAIKKTQ